jgi:hypothetical protein
MNGFNGGNSMDLGSGDAYGSGGQARDGSRPASAACGVFDVLTWRI